MKYFIINDSLNEEIVGGDYPQVYKFIKGYDERAPNALFSLYDYWNCFPDYEPNLDGLMLAGYAKLTDFVSSPFSDRLRIISPRTKETLEQFNLCSHRFYPLGLYKRKVKHDYFLFHIVSDYSNYVDYERTSFMEIEIGCRYRSEPFFVESREDFLEKRTIIKSEKGLSWGIWGDRIVMNKEFNHELDFFEINMLDTNTYVSERLKNTIEYAGLTGLEFTPATNLIVED